jgi:hypothetical protein
MAVSQADTRAWLDEKPLVDPTSGRVAIAAAKIERRKHGN